MLIFGVIAYAMAIFFISLLIARTKDSDMGKMATYIILIAWGSLIFGIYISKSAL